MEDRAVREARRRAFRYYYEDGLVELSIGGFFTVIGLLLWVFTVGLAGSPYAWLLGVGLVVVTVSGVFVTKAVVMRLKRDVTYPRTGRVTYQEKPGSGMRLRVIVAALAIMVAVIWLPDWLNNAALTSGALLTVVLLSIGGGVGLLRLQVAAILPVVVGLVVSYFELGELLGNAIVFGASGLLLALLGTVAFSSYLRLNQLAEGEDDDD